MMVEDRFYEPETKSIADQLEEAYERYLEDFEGEEDEKPMTYEEFEDVTVWR
jgi:hypothetical protein